MQTIILTSFQFFGSPLREDISTKKRWTPGMLLFGNDDKILVKMMMIMMMIDEEGEEDEIVFYPHSQSN